MAEQAQQDRVPDARQFPHHDHAYLPAWRGRPVVTYRTFGRRFEAEAIKHAFRASGADAPKQWHYPVPRLSDLQDMMPSITLAQATMELFVLRCLAPKLD